MATSTLIAADQYSYPVPLHKTNNTFTLQLLAQICCCRREVRSCLLQIAVSLNDLYDLYRAKGAVSNDFSGKSVSFERLRYMCRSFPHLRQVCKFENPVRRLDRF